MNANELTTHDLAHLLKVIADESRLRILGLLAERARTGTELAEALGLSAPTVSHHMRKLVESGLVSATADAQRQVYALDSAFLLHAKRAPAADATPVAGPADDRAKVIRNFFDGERLRSIPAKRKQRVIVLQHLLTRFEPGREYPEREVNEILGAAHEDYASLRRELVDYGYLTRDRGMYAVSRSLPERSIRFQDEIPAGEQDWFRGLIQAALHASRGNA
jgi:biotin operon repressor